MSLLILIPYWSKYYDIRLVVQPLKLIVFMMKPMDLLAVTSPL